MQNKNRLKSRTVVEVLSVWNLHRTTWKNQSEPSKSTMAHLKTIEKRYMGLLDGLPVGTVVDESHRESASYTAQCEWLERFLEMI